MTKLIAEFCQNHNGNIDTLSRMIDQAAESGATHGKMQSISADTVAYRPQFEEGLEINGVIKFIKRPYIDEYNRLKKLEITETETLTFIGRCKEYGLIPMTTCFTRCQAKSLSEMGFRSIKVASYDCASFPLLRDLRSLFDEIIVSTGASYEDEVIKASEILHGTKFSFLHCVTLYPTPLHEMHLARMNWLKELAPSVGFSDHSLFARDGLIASKAAITMGAEIIERHFTILDTHETKDGPVSIDPKALKELADFSKLSKAERLDIMNHDYPKWSEVLLGNEHRFLSEAELLNRDYYRGRFASPRSESINGSRMIYNWEDINIA